MHRPSLPGECWCGPTWHKSTFDTYPIRIAYVSKRIQRFDTFRNYALIRIFADTYYFVDTENTRIISEISNTIRIKYTNTPYLYWARYVSNNPRHIRKMAWESGQNSSRLVAMDRQRRGSGSHSQMPSLFLQSMYRYNRSDFASSLYRHVSWCHAV